MKKLGHNYRLQVESAVPGTYNTVAGEQTLSVNRSASPIDTTSKDQFPYGSSRGGSRSLSIPFGCIPDLPDANGYDRLVTLANDSDGTPFNIRIIDTSDSDNVVLECSVTVSDRNNTLDQGAPAGATCTFINSAAPVTDDL
jgi:hypothetical protein